MVLLAGYADERVGTAIEEVLSLHDRFSVGSGEPKVDAKVPSWPEALHPKVQLSLQQVAYQLLEVDGR